MSSFVADIRANLHADQARRELENLTRNQQVNIEVRLTGNYNNLTQTLNNIQRQATQIGQTIGANLTPNINNQQLNNFFDNYFRQLQQSRRRAEQVFSQYAPQYQITRGDAHRSITAETSAIQRQQREASRRAIRDYEEDFRRLRSTLSQMGDLELKITGLDPTKNANEIAELTSQFERLDNAYSVLYGHFTDSANNPLVTNVASMRDLIELDEIHLKYQNKIAQTQAKQIDSTIQGTNAELAKQVKKWEEDKKKLHETAQSYTDKFNSGKYSADAAIMTSNVNKYVNQENINELKVARQALTDYQKTYDDVKRHFDASDSLSFSDEELIAQFKNMETAAGRYKNAMREVAVETTRSLGTGEAITKSNEILTYFNNNTKAAKEFGAALKDLAKRAEEATTKGQLDEINAEFKKLKSTISEKGLTGKSWTQELKRAVKNIAEFTSIYGVLQNVIQDLPREMVSAIKELDDAVTDFTMATNANESQVSKLLDTYSKLGDELSATVTDVTISATEWLKQGKSIAEAETLISDAMILSKVGKLSSADATQYLTSVMKGYKVSVEDTLGVVDKLSAVDMASATDVGGLAEGMSKVASSADLAGVSMDKLLGYLAAVGEVTQSGMSETGTTFNAIFSRMGNIKLSRLKDYQNNGEDLSNVETVLRGEGIKLRDTAGEFREFDEVLDEVASRWTSFSEVSQRAIASAFAGTHHLNSFIILMENYGAALKYSEVAMDSSGSAMEKFEAYEDSISGKTEKLENAFINLSNSLVNSNLVKSFIDIGTTGVNAFNDLLNAITPFGAVGIGASLFASIKNVGKGKTYPFKIVLNSQQ